MITYLVWKVAGNFNIIRCLGSGFKEIRVRKFSKIMSYFSQRSLSSSGLPISENDYDYHTNNGLSYYRRRGHTNTQRYEGDNSDTWENLRDLSTNLHYLKALSERIPTRRYDYPVNVNCGQLRPSDRDTLVCIKGRVQVVRMNRFVHIMDSHGVTQLFVLEERFDLIRQLQNLAVDSYIEVLGTVVLRQPNKRNTAISTGEIEVVIDKILDVVTPKRKMYDSSADESSKKKARSSKLITRLEMSRCETDAVKKKFMQRSHNCGELDESHAHLEVNLCGWIESKRRERFMTLRDGYGTLQLHSNPSDPILSGIVRKIDVNTLVTAKGIITLRPSPQKNINMATGNIELDVKSLEIINPHEPVNEETNAKACSSNESQHSEPSQGDVNSYTGRTHNCGQLRGSDVGKYVILCGWLHSVRTNRFVVIRDGHGTTQLIIPTELQLTVSKELAEINLESVIKVEGVVCARPFEQITTEKDATGEIEVVLKSFSLLNPARKSLPFIVRDHNKPKEPLRMKYRYLDLRFSDMQYKLRTRSKVLMRMREFLINQRGFVEVETPTLFRRTPGGAQEFVVPTRSEDKFYSLVQSPQQLKQLLMIGAIDRYFQVARCYRDEGARPDRQPEFTQMDIELSFTDRDSILLLIEDLLRASWPEELPALQAPFPVISYHDSMHWYGTDKPDLRFDIKLIDISEIIIEDSKKALPERIRNAKNFTAKALVFNPNEVDKAKKVFKDCEELQKMKNFNQAELKIVTCAVNKWKTSVDAALPFVDAEQLKDFLQLSIPCTIAVGVGEESEVLPLLGKLRSEVFGNDSSNFHFAWIVDFPLFLQGDDGQLESAHHPFTQPNPEDAHLLSSDPLKVKGLHFDLVLNGYEVGGGSVRIHDAALQTDILKDILKIPVSSLNHLLEALSSGAPPHGGIALGIDRLLALMMNADTIREVIAFPKSFDGKDPLSGAPCAISDEEKKLYHLVPQDYKRIQ